MAKQAYVYDGSQWVDIAQSVTDLTNYPNMTTTAISGFRNSLINGDFKIWQRGTSLTQSGGGVGVDMWREYTDTGSGTQSRDTTVGATGVTAQSYKFTVGGSATNWSLWQIIESANCAHLIGQTVTLSFYAQVSSARSINVAFAYSTTTDAPWTGTWVTFGTTAVALTTTMTRYSVTVAVPANTKTLQASFSSGGTNFAAGFTINVTGVQLERGTVVTPFEQRPIGTELALCQRYYYQISNPDNLVNARWSVGVQSTTTASELLFHLPVSMRIRPAVTYAGGVSITDAFSFTQAITSIALAASISNPMHFQVGHSAVGASRYPIFGVFTNNTGFVYFSSEL